MASDATSGNSEPEEDDREAIKISENGIELPVVELLTGRGFITGKTGSGKSNSASVIAEELLKSNFPLLIVDTDGEYYGLKEHFEVLHLGADEECDLQVGVEHAEKIAAMALEENIPIILDISSYLHDDEAKDLLTEVSHHLFSKEKKLKKPFLIVLEEVHEYIPESRGLDECGRMLVKIAKRGRKHGLGLAGISQRPADVKKDFITQCDWLVWHRLTWENDTKVVRRVVGPDYANTVQDLGDGEGILMTDWNDKIRSVQFRRKETFDAGATPGLEDFERPELKSVSEDIIEELEEISEREHQRQTELDRVRSKLEKKENRITELEDELERAQDVSDLAEDFTKALTQTATSGNVEEIEETVEELREKKNETIRNLRAENEELREKNAELQERIEVLEEQAEVTERVEHIEANLDEAAEAYARLGEALGLATEDDEKERLKERVEALQETINSLEGQGHEVTSIDYKRFVEDEAVQAQIDAAKTDAPSPRYVKGVVATILEHGDSVSYDDISDHLGISTTSHVGTAVNVLQDHGVVIKSKRGREAIVDFNIGEIQEIRNRVKRREHSEKVLGEI